MKKAVQKHNGNISLYKFLFAMMILLHHCTYIVHEPKLKLFVTGSIGVEFFFLVSGFLLAKKVYSEEEKKKNKEPLYQSTWKFIWKKIKSFYPYLVFSFILYVLISFFFDRQNPLYYARTLIDLTLIQEAGFPNDGIIRVSWYLSAMVLSMLIIYPLVKKYKDTFLFYIAPLIALFVGGYLLHDVTSGYTLRTYSYYKVFLYMGMGRAFFEISLGTTIYGLCEKLKKVNFTKLGTIFLLVLQTICFGLVFVGNIFFKTRQIDWFFIALIFIGILLGFSEKLYGQEKFNNKFFYFLEKLSLPMYLNNYIFVRLINYTFLKEIPLLSEKLLLVVVGTVLLSILELFIVKYILKVYVKAKLYFKSKIIETS